MSRHLFVPVLALALIAPASLGQNLRTDTRQELHGALTEAQVMKLLYGDYDNSEKVSVWTATRTNRYPRDWPDKINVRVLLDASYIEAGKSMHLLVTWAIPKDSYEGEYSCHSCGVLLGLARLVKEGGAWRIEARDLVFGVYGSWGHAPMMNLQPIGPDRFGLIMPTGFGAQGVWQESVQIIVPHANKFVEAISIQTAQTWDDDRCSGKVIAKHRENCFAYDGGIEWDSTPNSPYYDLLLTRRVYRSLAKGNSEGTTVSRYRFNGSKYIPVSAAK